MRTLVLPLLLGLGCSTETLHCLDDFDGDGLCGLDDPCPADPLNDADQDGVCDDVDTCLEGPDDLDADADGIADACDVCPADALNDGDEDGICDSVDPCPGDDTNTCSRDILLALQADAWPAEITFGIYDGDDNELMAGTFSEPAETLFERFVLPVGNTRLCVDLTDGFGDGGVSGWMWDEGTGHLMTEWSFRDWTNQTTWCGELLAQAPSGDAPTWDEDLWPDVGSCDVQLIVDTLTWANEIGYKLTTGARRSLLRVDPGSLSNDTTYTYDLHLYEGEHRMVMYDTLGDSWHGGTFKVIIPPNTEPIVMESMPDGPTRGAVPFLLDCPDPRDTPEPPGD